MGLTRPWYPALFLVLGVILSYLFVNSCLCVCDVYLFIVDYIVLFLSIRICFSCLCRVVPRLGCNLIFVSLRRFRLRCSSCSLFSFAFFVVFVCLLCSKSYVFVVFVCIVPRFGLPRCG